MPSIATVEQRLAARAYYTSTWNGGARWAFFAIFLVVIAIVIFGTIRVNKRRSQTGVKPIYGTRWMTPPSYYQSQGQYNQPTRRDPDLPAAYVPEYSAQANANDMGHYAADGTFHANPSAKGPVYPENAHPRTTTNADGHPIQNLEQPQTRVVADEDGDFARPAGPPPTSATAPHDDTGDFERPSGPPPSSSAAQRSDTENFARPPGPPPAR